MPRSNLKFRILSFQLNFFLVHLELHAESYEYLEWSGEASRKYTLRWLFVPWFFANELMIVFYPYRLFSFIRCLSYA
jgi:hypothetical protein